MSLRILFADDSMTAQNMGKKILSEAGYDVVAVSNGAAAVKKIAEQKPDIIILDVYMPGYSGLEVCEKVRGSLDTLKTPVLLTVGKMEPFKSEDGNRVKADGVIIKPFEATDLLAIVKKFEERIGNTPPPPMVAQTVVADPVEETAAVQPEPAVEQHSTGKRASVQPMVEVPDHMASSAAFGDMLGGEPANSTSHFAVNTPAATFETSVIVPAPPVPTEHEVPSPALEAPEPPVAVSEQVIPEEVSAPIETVPDFISAPVEEIPAPIEPDTQPIMAEAPAPAPVAEAAHPQFIPVFKDPEPQREPEAEYAFMPTSVAPIGDLEIPREPALQETAEETTRSTEVTQVEPGLMSTIGQQVEAFPAQALDAAVVPPPPPIETSAAAASAPQASYSAPAPMPVSEAATEVTDADFEARVAAAMAAYNQASEPESKPSSAPELGQVIADHAQAIAVPEVPEVHAIEPQPEEPPAVSEQVPSFEYQPPVRATEPAPIANAATANAGSAYEHIAPRIEAPAPPSPSPVPMSVDPAVVAASVEAAMPEAAASVAAEAGDHHHTIAAAVHRVMERLKPELVEEIMKELRSKK